MRVKETEGTCVLCTGQWLSEALHLLAVLVWVRFCVGAGLDYASRVTVFVVMCWWSWCKAVMWGTGRVFQQKGMTSVGGSCGLLLHDKLTCIPWLNLPHPPIFSPIPLTPIESTAFGRTGFVLLWQTQRVVKKGLPWCLVVTMVVAVIIVMVVVVHNSGGSGYGGNGGVAEVLMV